ncbi:hypothetical protein [Aliarcobacter vitoriensis]|uniref:Uncharacterized protein n=1 Tax=Aliarcobacter vitoriensis TaxID=2011099 RepID=A0A366MS22_9BACT|nr:hypothetical protein [Aliarcobacter vitoriensis]RBQ28410.1 hypothetical protein CRU91_09320 [Aliarcobacter vitoriensis]
MAIDKAKAKVKKILSLDLIDAVGIINTQGNYIYLVGTRREDTLNTKYTFAISIMGHSLVGSSESSEQLLEQALKEIYDYEVGTAKDLEVSSKLVEFEELLGYVVTLSLIETTK